MRRRRSGKVAYDQKVVQDVGMAALAVRILPMVINNFFPLNQTIYTVVGTGAGYMVGTLLKNKTMANASIAMGLVEFVAPVIEDMIGGFGAMGSNSDEAARYMPPVQRRYSTRPPGADPEGSGDLADYIRLNDYVPAPSNRHYSDYSEYY